MRILEFGSEVGEPLAGLHPEARFEIREVVICPILRSPQGVRLAWFRYEPNGIVGAHPAASHQLFLVVEGRGWTSGADDRRVAVRAGQAVHWSPGERHASGSGSGMTALVVEARELDVLLPDRR